MPGAFGPSPTPTSPAVPAPEADARLTFRWPLEVVQITSPYGRRPNPFARKKHRRRGGGGRMHKGVDLNGGVGDQVLAAAGGRVKQAGWYYGFGKHVSIEHPGGFLTRYAHLSEVMVYPGQVVRAGAPIGLVGSTGHSTGPHLHFGLEKNGKTVDPRRYVGKPQEGVMALRPAPPMVLDAPAPAPAAQVAASSPVSPADK
jgi:murein DD-endopeptidase MepM/ murein hydrolase activator NlpD